MTMVSPAHRRAACSKAALLALLLSMLAQKKAAATPQQFVSTIAKTGCTQHPQKAYALHGAPLPDT